jgi:hypothetical protein
VQRISLGRNFTVGSRRPLEHNGFHIPQVARLRAPRWIGAVDRNHSQDHVFCHANEHAYGSAMCIRSCMAATTWFT